MLAETKSLIAAIERDIELEKTDPENYGKFYCREDHDLGEVLKFCSGGKLKKHKLRFSDNSRKTLSFEK